MPSEGPRAGGKGRCPGKGGPRAGPVRPGPKRAALGTGRGLRVRSWPRWRPLLIWAPGDRLLCPSPQGQGCWPSRSPVSDLRSSSITQQGRGVTWVGVSLPRRSPGTKAGARPAGGVGWPCSVQSQTPDGQGPDPRGPLWGGRAPAAVEALGCCFLGRGTQTLKSPGLQGCLDESWARAQELPWPSLRGTGPERRGFQGRV